jgi:hypothetical protein
MPDEESEFFDLLKIFFPKVYDIKYLMKSCKNLKGGLQEVAEQMEVCVHKYYAKFYIVPKKGNSVAELVAWVAADL